MSEDETIDYATLRVRFPWVGLAPTAETDLSARHREIQARSRIDLEAIDAVRHIARIPLLCDSGPLIATFSLDDMHHERCTRLLARWPGKLFVPEPVLGETCNFSAQQRS